MICHFLLLAPLLVMFHFFHACYSLLSCTFVACFHCLFLLLVFIALSLSLFIHFCYFLLLLTFVIHFYYLFCSLQQALACCSLTTTRQTTKIRYLFDMLLLTSDSLLPIIHFWFSTFANWYPPFKVFFLYDFIFLCCLFFFMYVIYMLIMSNCLLCAKFTFRMFAIFFQMFYLAHYNLLI